MVKHYFKADITTPKGAPRINYPPGWYENAGKIFVRAYDDPNSACIAMTEDDELFNKLMASGKVVEMTAEDFETEVERVRPKPPEVTVALTGAGKDQKTDIETLLKAKGVTYRIEEA